MIKLLLRNYLLTPFISIFCQHPIEGNQVIENVRDDKMTDVIRKTIKTHKKKKRSLQYAFERMSRVNILLKDY